MKTAFSSVVLSALLIAAQCTFAQQSPPGPAQPNAVAPVPAIPANPPHAAEVRGARAAADDWLKLLDAGNFDQAYQRMTVIPRTQITQSAWRDQMKAARARAGRLVSRTFQSFDFTTALKGAPVGEYVVIHYLLTFDTQHSALETVVMTRTDNAWQVAGFSVA